MKKINVLLLISLVLIVLSGCSINTEENLYKADERYVGINLSGVSDSSTQYPFKDLFKMTRTWRTDSSKDVEYICDENGWVKNLNGNSEAVAYLATDFLPQTNYVLTYDGSGTITIIGKYIQITNKEEGKIEFTITENDNSSTQNNRIKITSVDEDYIRNIQVIEEQFINDLEDIFNPTFISNINIFSDIRFMDWMDTNNTTVSSWSDRPKVDDTTWTIKGVPVEVMVDLCNETKSNPWFCMPEAATDEYIEEFAKYVNENLDENLTVYIENSNETWNGQFSADDYNYEQGLNHPNIGNIGDKWKVAAYYYAQRSVEMFLIWEENYENNLIKVLGSQSNNTGIGTTVTNYELANGTYAGDYADALAIAPYIGNNIQSTDQTEIFDLLTADLETRLRNNIVANKVTADKYDLRLICYEAGQHLEQSSYDSYTEAFTIANSSDEMGVIYNEYLNIWLDEIGDKIFLFNSTGLSSKYGSWGLLQHQYQPHNEAIKFYTVKKWIEDNPKT